jgi:hypothetical protein
MTFSAAEFDERNRDITLRLELYTRLVLDSS